MGKRAYDCEKCPAICCTVYEAVSVNDRDVERLAASAGLPADIFAAFYPRPGYVAATELLFPEGLS